MKEPPNMNDYTGELILACPNCNARYWDSEYRANDGICEYCGYVDDVDGFDLVKGPK